MKLSKSTIDILKNFKEINQSILFKQGNKLRTISVMKNILAEASIGEEFPKDFGIYDLNVFLNILSTLHSDPDLDFDKDEYLIIREGKKRNKFFFADPNVIVSPPDKSIELPSEDVFKAFYLDYKILVENKTFGKLATQLNYEKNGFKSIMPIIDKNIIDRTWDNCAVSIKKISSQLSVIQNGQAQQYLIGIPLGLFIVTFVFLLWR